MDEPASPSVEVADIERPSLVGDQKQSLVRDTRGESLASSGDLEKVEEDLEKQHEAARAIQKNFRAFKKRKLNKETKSLDGCRQNVFISSTTALKADFSSIPKGALKGALRKAAKMTEEEKKAAEEDLEALELGGAQDVEAAAEEAEKKGATTTPLGRQLRSGDPSAIYTAYAVLETFKQGLNADGEPTNFAVAQQAKNEIRKLAVAMRLLRDMGIGKFLRTHIPKYDQDEGEPDEEKGDKAKKMAKMFTRQSNVLATLLDVQFDIEPVEKAEVGLYSPPAASSSLPSPSAPQSPSVSAGDTVPSPSLGSKRLESESVTSSMRVGSVPSTNSEGKGEVQERTSSTTVTATAATATTATARPKSKKTKQIFKLKKFTAQFPYYTKFISEEFEQLELMQLRKMLEKTKKFCFPFGQGFPFPVGTRISPLEKQGYRRLLVFLHYYGEATDNAGIPAEDAKFARQLRDELQTLRCLELRPASRRVDGFVNKLDNILCLLLYRERVKGDGSCPTPQHVTPFDPEYKETQDDIKLKDESERIVNLKQQLQASQEKQKLLQEDVENEEKRQQELKVKLVDLQSGKDDDEDKEEEETFEYTSENFGLYFGLLQFTLVLCAFGFTWNAWTRSGWFLMETQMQRVSEETRKAVASSAAVKMDSLTGMAGVLRAAHLAGDIDLGENWTEMSADYQHLDEQLIGIFNLFGTKTVGEALYIGTKNGDFLGVFYSDVIASSKCEETALKGPFSATVAECKKECKTTSGCVIYSHNSFSNTCYLFPACQNYSAWSTDPAVRSANVNFTSYTPIRLQIRAKAANVANKNTTSKCLDDTAVTDKTTCYTDHPFWTADNTTRYYKQSVYTQFELTPGKNYRNPATGTIRTATYSPELRGWFTGGKKNTKTFLTWSDPYAFTSAVPGQGVPGLTIAIKGLDPRGTGNLSDVSQTFLFWAADVTLSGLGEILRRIPLVENRSKGVAYLTQESTGLLIASSSQEEVSIKAASGLRVKYAANESQEELIRNTFKSIQSRFPPVNASKNDGLKMEFTARDALMAKKPSNEGREKYENDPYSATIVESYGFRLLAVGAFAEDNFSSSIKKSGRTWPKKEEVLKATEPPAAQEGEAMQEGLLLSQSQLTNNGGTPSDAIPTKRLDTDATPTEGGPKDGDMEVVPSPTRQASDGEGGRHRKRQSSIFRLQNLLPRFGSNNDGTQIDEDEEVDTFNDKDPDTVDDKLLFLKEKFGAVRNFFFFHSKTISWIAGFTVIIFMVVIWIVWTLNVTVNVRFGTELLINQTIFRVRNSVWENMNSTTQAVNVVMERALRGEFELPWNEAERRNREIFLNGVFESFRKAEAFDSLIDQYSISYLYVGWADGTMDAAGLCDIAGGKLGRCVAARSPGPLPNQTTLDVCYTKYKVADSPSGQTRIPIDFASPPYGAPNCAYDPRLRGWYTAAVNAKGPVFGKIYTFTGGTLGITFSAPFYDPNDSSKLQGVVACDIRLDLMGNFLSREVNLGGESGSRAFMLQLPYGELLATNLKVTGEIEPDPPKQAAEPAALLDRASDPIIKYCLEICDASMKQTCKYLHNRCDGDICDAREKANLNQKALNCVNKTKHNYTTEQLTSFSYGLIKEDLTLVLRGKSQPLTYTSMLYDANHSKGLNWGLVVTGDYQDFYGKLENEKILTLIVTLACLSIVMFILLHGLNTYAAMLEKIRQNFISVEDSLSSLESEGVSKEVLEELMEKDLGAGSTFKQVVLRAAGKKWKETNSLDYTAKGPIDHSTATHFTEKRALQHVLDTMEGINVLSKCHLESLDTSVPLWLYEFLENDFYEFGLVQTSIIIHILLMFWEPTTLYEMQEKGVRVEILIIEFFCLFVEISNVFILMLVKFHYKAVNFLDFKAGTLKMTLLISVLFLVTIDWLLTCSRSFSFEYYFPLRVWIFVFMNARVYKAAEILARTIIGGKEVYALYSSFVLIAAVTGIALFKNPEEFEFGEYVNNFVTFPVALITSFVYISTGENYNDLVYPAYEVSPIYLVWFLIFTVMGMFFVVGIVIEAFTDSFNGLQTEDLKNTYLFSRTGAVSAFILLDLDESMYLSGGEMAGFLTHLGTYFDLELKDSDLVKIFYTVDKDFDGVVTIFEFVHGVEEVFDLVAANNLKEHVPDNSWTAKFRRTTQQACLYGVLDQEDTLTYVNTGLLCVSVAEQVVRLFASGGFNIYWNHAKYHDGAVEEQWANRVELCCVTLAAVGFITTTVITETTKDSDNPIALENFALFFLALPIVRLLTFNQMVRHLMWCLVLIIPISWNLLLLLLMMLFWFAQLGVMLFKDSFDVLEWEDNGSAPDGNFNNLVNGLLTLFQVMGVGGSDVMFAAVEALGFGYIWYFLLFTIVIQILFMNLFVGVVLSMFGIAKPMTNPTSRTIQKQRLKEELFKQEEHE
eukprot:g26114.t1